jgi:hypothetical protein
MLALTKKVDWNRSFEILATSISGPYSATLPMGLHKKMVSVAKIDNTDHLNQ